MSYFAKFTILWILYNILACTEQNKETYTKDHSDSVIKVEIENDLLDHLDILPIVDTIIPLEVTENNLIGMVGKIRQYHDDYYIFDVQRRKINVFDNSGRFKYNLGQEGKGPGELVFPGDFFADLSLDAVAVSDIRTGRVNYFNTSGQIIKEIPMAQKGVNFINGISIPEGVTWVLNHEWLNNEYEYVVKLNSTSGKIVASFLSPGIEFYSSTTNPMFLTYNGSNVYLSLAYDNEIYELSPDSVSMKYRIDFGRYNLTAEEKNQNKYVFLETLHRTDRASGIINFNKLKNDILYFAFDIGLEKYHYFYDEKRQQGIGAKNIVLSGIPVQIWGYDQNFQLIGNINHLPESISVSKKKAESEKEENILEIIHKIDFETSNPVLVKFNNVENIFLDQSN